MEKIFLPTVRAMAQEGRPFQGVLYFGLMITPEGPKVVEYNARFGDPECQVVLMLLESDLLSLMEATRTGTLDQVPVNFRDASGCVVVLASGGYPGKYETGLPIAGLDQVEESGDTQVFHAGTKLGEDGAILTAGGRVLGVTALGDTLEQAIANAYSAAKPISFQDMHFRTDIGKV